MMSLHRYNTRHAQSKIAKPTSGASDQHGISTCAGRATRTVLTDVTNRRKRRADNEIIGWPATHRQRSCTDTHTLHDPQFFHASTSSGGECTTQSASSEPTNLSPQEGAESGSAKSTVCGDNHGDNLAKPQAFNSHCPHQNDNQIPRLSNAERLHHPTVAPPQHPTPVQPAWLSDPIIIDVLGRSIKHLHVLEDLHQIPSNILAHQKQLSAEDRHKVIDWMLGIVQYFRMNSTVWFLAIIYVDRLLAVRNINNDEMEMHALTAIHLASKYENGTALKLQKFRKLIDNERTIKEFKRCEVRFLQALNFDLGTPAPNYFFYVLADKLGLDDDMYYIARFVLDLAVCNIDMCGFRPSEIASASIYVALMKINSSESSERRAKLRQYSRFHMDNSSAPVVTLIKIVNQASQDRYTNIWAKYHHIQSA